MTDGTKQKFLVLYLIPTSVMEDWAKTELCRKVGDDGVRKAA